MPLNKLLCVKDFHFFLRILRISAYVSKMYDDVLQRRFFFHILHISVCMNNHVHETVSINIESPISIQRSVWLHWHTLQLEKEETYYFFGFLVFWFLVLGCFVCVCIYYFTYSIQSRKKNCFVLRARPTIFPKFFVDLFFS